MQTTRDIGIQLDKAQVETELVAMEVTEQDGRKVEKWH